VVDFIQHVQDFFEMPKNRVNVFQRDHCCFTSFFSDFTRKKKNASLNLVKLTFLLKVMR
jgi:hypothetical protein